MVSRRRSRMARWVGRDLRANWLAIVVVALVIAIGTGVYAGLGSTGHWRRASNDASFAALEMHDLRVSLAPGTFVDEGRLRAIVDTTVGEDVTAASERLVLATQVDASTPDEAILVGGRIVGLAGTDGPDRLWVDRGVAPSDASAVLEVKFANTYDLPSRGRVQVSGGEHIDYAGLGSLPTDFYVSGERGDLLAQFNFAVIYTTLARAQDVGGRDGLVNDLVLTVADDTDRDAVQAELDAAFSGASGVSATITTQDDDEAFRILYADIDADQRFWTVLAAIVLAGAALASFNLVSRMVEAQRREIGVGMAIGVETRVLVIRPLLVGIEIALLGVVLGIGVGLGIGAAMRSLLVDLAPLPVWLTDFQPTVYAQAAAIGVVVPILSAAVPVWRAVRVEPIDAIRTTHLAGRRPPRLLRRIRLPGSSLNQMPLRNLLRTPRRTALTALGVAAAITALVAVVGMLDSFSRTIALADDEVSKGPPGRITVALDGFQALDSDVLADVAALPVVAQIDPGMQLPASVQVGDAEVDVLVESIDFETAAWTPSGVALDTVRADSLILAADAAGDLGVSVGDVVDVHHPALTGTAVAMDTTAMTVAGLHPNPLRVFAYIDDSAAAAWGFADIANVAQVTPTDPGRRDELQAALFATPGVASAQPATRQREVFEDAMDQFTGFLVIAEGAVVALASLIAFNSARITVEERRREHATMLAFGAPVREVVATVMKEGVLVGAMATAVGIGAGYLTLRWMIDQLVADTLPELGVVVDLQPTTVLTAAVIGVAAVSLTPLFLIRRIRSMNLPSTLRVVE